MQLVIALLVLLPLLSSANEYYVRPSESRNTSCTAQPCLTLNQYANNMKDYFKSSTVFYFLPGKHYLDRPLELKDVHNLTLKGLLGSDRHYPHVLARFQNASKMCTNDERSVCCTAAFCFKNVSNVMVKEILLLIQTQNISAFTMTILSRVSFEMVDTYCEINFTCPFGLNIFRANAVNITLYNVYGFKVGIAFVNVANALLTDSKALYNSQVGLYLSNLFNGKLVNLTANENGWNTPINTTSSSITTGGIILSSITNTFINNLNASLNIQNGIALYDVENCYIDHLTTLKNNWDGLYIFSMKNSNIANTISSFNLHSGVFLQNVNSTSVSKTFLEKNGLGGMNNQGIFGCFFTNTITVLNGQNGMYFFLSQNTSITNTTTQSNGWAGFVLRYTADIAITNLDATYNGQNGLDLSGNNNTIIYNARTMYNKWYGGFMSKMSITVLFNMTASNNSQYGMAMFFMNHLNITNIRASSNGWNGVHIDSTNNSFIENTFVTWNDQHGLFLYLLRNSSISRLTASYNAWNGIVLLRVTNTSITHTSTLHNGYDGLNLEKITSMNMINTTTKQNGYNGITLSRVNNTNILNTVAKLNGMQGAYLTLLTHTNITNTLVANNTQGGMRVDIMNMTFVTNTIILNNGLDGLALQSVSNSKIVNTFCAYNKYHGVNLFNIHNSHIITLSSIGNEYSGVYMYITQKVVLSDITAAKNHGQGITMTGSHGIFFINPKLDLNRDSMVFNPKYAVKYGLLFAEKGQFMIHSSSNITILNGSFANIGVPRVFTTTSPSSVPVVIAVFKSQLVLRDCAFFNNSISGVRAHLSNITLSGNFAFVNNSAIFGTGLILLQKSMLILKDKSRVIFQNNHASNTGGVFYINVNAYVQIGDIISNATCFFDTSHLESQTEFVFLNNSAGKGGDILYGGQLILSLNNGQNCLESFKGMSNFSQSGLSLISSDPSRVCFCNNINHPDCLLIDHPQPYSIYPGQTITISAVIVGQNFGTVSGPVYAQFLPVKNSHIHPQVYSWQKSQIVTQDSCNQINYTIFSHNEVSKHHIVLTAQNSFVSTKFSNTYSGLTKSLLRNVCNTSDVDSILLSNNPIYASIVLLPCPLGFSLTHTEPYFCDCTYLLNEMDGVECYIQEQIIRRTGIVWVGLIEMQNDVNNETLATSRYCPLDYCHSSIVNISMTKPDDQCNYNHSGILCGGCPVGLSLALGTSQCLKCSNSYLALLIPFIIAGPTLVGLLKVLDITVSKGTLNGFIFYANIIHANKYIFLPWTHMHPLAIIIAWLNLDLGVETCFFHGLTAYSKTWLQFLFPIYIWSIAGLIIVLARYSNRMARAMGNNSVPVLATLFFLSYAKLLRTIITALTFTILHTSHGPQVVWSADGNVHYLGHEHAPLFAAAVATLLFLWLPYTLLLFLGQWMYWSKWRLITALMVRLKPLLDVHHGPMKAGHRYWFGALLLIRAGVLLLSALLPVNKASTVVFCVSLSATVLTHFGQVVYCHLAVAIFDTAYFMNLALLSGATLYSKLTGGNNTIASYALISLALTQFSGLVLFKLLGYLKKNSYVMSLFRKHQGEEDNWELYENSALLREREMLSETESSSSSEVEDNASVENIRSY